MPIKEVIRVQSPVTGSQADSCLSFLKSSVMDNSFKLCCSCISYTTISWSNTVASWDQWNFNIFWLQVPKELIPDSQNQNYFWIHWSKCCAAVGKAAWTAHFSRWVQGSSKMLHKATGKLAAIIKHAHSETICTVRLFTVDMPVLLFLLFAFCPQNTAFLEAIDQTSLFSDLHYWGK